MCEREMWRLVDSNEIPFSPYPKGTSNIKRIIEQSTTGTKRFTGFGMLELPPGGVFPQHTHPDREEIYHVISGSGTVMIEDREIQVRDGLTIYVSGEVPHGIRNQSDRPLIVLFVHAQV